MKEFIIDAEKSFIGAWYLEDTSVCDELIEYFEQSKELQRPGEVIENAESVIREDVKKSLDIPLPYDVDVSRKYVDELQKVCDAYKLKYPGANNVSEFGIEAINIQKYNPGGAYYEWHAERISGAWDSGRHLVFMTYLNDVDDAGGTEFEYQKFTATPKKGLTLIWPADWTHTHRGVPSPTQTKYIVTGWYRFFPD
jgi:prolyl 4-hydroxylase